MIGHGKNRKVIWVSIFWFFLRLGFLSFFSRLFISKTIKRQREKERKLKRRRTKNQETQIYFRLLLLSQKLINSSLGERQQQDRR